MHTDILITQRINPCYNSLNYFPSHFTDLFVQKTVINHLLSFRPCAKKRIYY